MTSRDGRIPVDDWRDIWRLWDGWERGPGGSKAVVVWRRVCLFVCLFICLWTWLFPVYFILICWSVDTIKSRTPERDMTVQSGFIIDKLFLPDLPTRIFCLTHILVCKKPGGYLQTEKHGNICLGTNWDKHLRSHGSIHPSQLFCLSFSVNRRTQGQITGGCVCKGVGKGKLRARPLRKGWRDSLHQKVLLCELLTLDLPAISHLLLKVT